MNCPFHNRWRVLFQFTLCLALCSLASSTLYCQAPENAVTRASEEENIREAVLRYQMTGYDSKADEDDEPTERPREASDKERRTILISISGQDPSKEFLKRLRDIPLQIKPASKGKFEKEPFPGWLVDKDTNERAVELYVNEIKWTSESKAEIEGGYYCGGLCAGHYKYKLIRSPERWIITSSELVGIS